MNIKEVRNIVYLFFYYFYKKLNMKKVLLFFIFFGHYLMFSQTEIVNTEPLDSLYREDQFYFSLTYNLPQNKPSGYSQYSFSTGLSLGFLRDIPISKNRHWALASGLGYAYNSLKHNLTIKKNNNTNSFAVNGNFNSNQLNLHYLEIPLEIRWRNSTMESHKFWRIYSGIKLSYVLASTSIFKSDIENFTIKNNNAVQKLQYGTYISFGYNTINLYAYYALNPVFKDAYLDTGEKINMQLFNIGFMFYIL